MSDSLLLGCAELIQAVIEQKGGKIGFLSQIDEHSHISHDIDIIVDDLGWRNIADAINALDRELGLQLLQIIQYDVERSIYCVFLRNHDSVIEFIKIDFLSDNYGIGIYGINTNKLLSETVLENRLRRPSKELELAYQLVKRVVKGYIEEDQFLRISLLDSMVSNKDLPNICKSGICKRDWARLIMCLQERDISLFREEICRVHHVWNSLRYLCNVEYAFKRLFKKVVRLKNRFSYPVGLDVFFATGDQESINTITNDLVNHMVTPFRNRIKVLPNKVRMAIVERYYYLVRGYLIINWGSASKLRNSLMTSTVVIHNNTIEEIISALRCRASNRVKVFFD